LGTPLKEIHWDTGAWSGRDHQEGWALEQKGKEKREEKMVKCTQLPPD